MRVGKYTFNCKFQSQAFLPQYKGSTLRGGFGHALKKISCALRRQKCDSCLLFETCAYAFLFELKKVLSFEAKNLRVSQRPHPYILVPPCDNKRTYEKDDHFSFDFILFGRANNYLPHILYAVREMGQNGLGKKSKSAGRFKIEEIIQNGQTVFSGDNLTTDIPLYDLTLEERSESEKSGNITFHCLTPLRLKYSNELQNTLPFHFIVRAALRRISTLEAVYGDGEPALDYNGIVARATDVKVVYSDCQWVDIERYSNRQKTAMMFGGIKGKITYEGDGLNMFLPLLHYCETTHLGKQTSFGLGKIAVQNSCYA